MKIFSGLWVSIRDEQWQRLRGVLLWFWCKKKRKSALIIDVIRKHLFAVGGHELVISNTTLNAQQINHVAFSLAHVLSNKNSEENLKVVDWPIFTITREKSESWGEGGSHAVFYVSVFIKEFPFFIFVRLNFIRPKLRTWKERREWTRERERESGNIRKLIRYEIFVCSPTVRTKQKALAQLLLCKITHNMPSMFGTSSFKPLRR